MSRFKFASHADKLAEAATEVDQKDAEEVENLRKSTALMLNIGSSGTKAVVQTEAYKSWLAKQQEINPFIGKSYMQRAEEYERDSEEVRPSEAMADNEAAKLLEKGEDGMLHLKDDILETEDDGEALTGAAAKFSDMCLINNIVATRVGWDFEAVMKDVTDALLDEHLDDIDFSLPDDLEETVNLSIKAAEYRAQLGYTPEK